MDNFISAFEVPRNLDKIVQEVLAHGDKFIGERDDSLVAVIVPIEVYEQWKRSREKFFEVLSLAQENANLTEATAFSLAEETVKAVRVE